MRAFNKSFEIRKANTDTGKEKEANPVITRDSKHLSQWYKHWTKSIYRKSAKENLNSTPNHLEVNEFSRLLYPTTAEYTLFTSTHETFKEEYVPGQNNK